MDFPFNFANFKLFFQVRSHGAHKSWGSGPAGVGLGKAGPA